MKEGCDGVCQYGWSICIVLPEEPWKEYWTSKMINDLWDHNVHFDFLLRHNAFKIYIFLTIDVRFYFPKNWKYKKNTSSDKAGYDVLFLTGYIKMCTFLSGVVLFILDGYSAHCKLVVVLNYAKENDSLIKFIKLSYPCSSHECALV